MKATPVEAARNELQKGHIGDAVALLRTAGASGDAVALVELAALYLRGDALPRDLAAARSFLRQAVTIGHVDGALMEIALTANGSGGAPDWRTATELLKNAAKADPVARQQLSLLQSMRLDPAGDPLGLPEPTQLNQRPAIRRFADFCTPAEALHIASVVAKSLDRSTVVDPSGKLIPHPIRTSDNAAIGPTQETLVVQAINRRIAAATKTDVKQGEPLTVLRYATGQEYRSHLDTLPRVSNQRITTAILYLNDGYEGGETFFPLLNVTIVPKAGDLLVFENVTPRGESEPLCRHAGLPIRGGIKWIATRWIRSAPISPWDLSVAARSAAAIE
jgi:prolyl 4-hydroxylase